MPQSQGWLDKYKQLRLLNRGGLTTKEASTKKQPRGKTAKSKSSASACAPIPVNDEQWTCQGCSGSYKNDTDLVITCDRCQNYWCTGCLEMSKEQYSAARRDDLFWFCFPCTQMVLTLIQTENVVEQHCKKIVTDVNEKIALMGAKLDDKFKKYSEDLEKSLQIITKVPEQINKERKTFADALKSDANKTATNATPNLKAIMKETLNETKKEEKALEDRKRNIIIFNAAEQADESPEERKANDINLFNSIFKTVCDQECENEVIQARRLGRIPENDSARPLLVTVKSEKTKRQLFSQLFKLRGIDQYRNISIGHDMTQKERKQTKLLVEEAKKKTADLASDTELGEEEKNWIFRVRGPPWEQKIVKVRPRTQV